MKKVLITGATGAVGLSFIKAYYDQYHFISLTRNKQKQALIKKKFNKIHTAIGSVENRTDLIQIFQEIKPDIVIHAAALKQITLGEEKPSEAIKTNIFGSLNVIDAAKIANVPIIIGISSDKACLSSSVYGHTKHLMERLFLEASNDANRFSCCRLGNIAGSHGSVIPLWVKMAAENKALGVTSTKMNRFVFLPNDVSSIIQKAIVSLERNAQPFVLTQNKKAVNLLELALSISPHAKIIGKRPGEKLNENLVSPSELPFTHIDDDFIFIKTIKNPSQNTRLKQSLSTLHAEKMDSDEIKTIVKIAGQFYAESAY